MSATDVLVRNDIILDTRVTPAMIRAVRKEMGLSLSEFGKKLKKLADPHDWRKSYNRQYVSGLEHGRFEITPAIASAVYSMAAKLDDVPAGIGGAVSVSVLARDGQVPEGTYIPASAEVDLCANPTCRVKFVKVNHFQLYHDPECRPK